MKKKQYRGMLSFRKGEPMILDLQAGLPIGPYQNAQEAGISDKQIMSLGMFGDNNNVFFEGATAESVIPKPEQFVAMPFRLLSATIVGAGTWRATDFTNTTMLRSAVPKLEGKPVYYDHDTDLMNVLGKVIDVQWDAARVQEDLNVPGGINGTVLIDTVTAPKIARHVLLGSIFSNSVTVEFMWEMSHPFEEEYDFNNKVGTIAQDGKMIRRVVTEITAFHETSLVWLGADPFAKLINEDGSLEHIDETAVYQEFSKTPIIPELEKESDAVRKGFSENNRYSLLGNFEKNIISLAASRVKPVSTEQPQTTDTMDDKLKEALRKILNLKAEDEITEDHIKSLQLKNETTENFLKKVRGIEALEKAAKDGDEFSDEKATTELDKFSFVETTELEKLREDVKELDKLEGEETIESLKAEAAKVEDLTADAEVGKRYLSAKKEEVIRLYKAKEGEDAEESVIELINKAEDKEIEGLMKQYVKGATEKFSGSCAECGSSKFNFKSSITDPDAGEGGTETASLETSFEEIQREGTKSQFVIRKQEQEAAE